ncbi:MAG: S24/S26 family peptidase [Chromatiales bacterium]|jgi:signal peptidase I|nr:S24/S26 family peptidase [Chromatiales bacterium]
MAGALFKVRGDSMAPTLLDGDYVIGRRPSGRRPLRIGDVVVLNHSYYGRMVKRISDCDVDGRFRVRGDNAMTVASIDVGAVSLEQIERRVVFRVSPGAIGRVKSVTA